MTSLGVEVFYNKVIKINKKLIQTSSFRDLTMFKTYMNLTIQIMPAIAVTISWPSDSCHKMEFHASSLINFGRSRKKSFAKPTGMDFHNEVYLSKSSRSIVDKLELFVSAGS